MCTINYILAKYMMKILPDIHAYSSYNMIHFIVIGLLFGDYQCMTGMHFEKLS